MVYKADTTPAMRLRTFSWGAMLWLLAAALIASCRAKPSDRSGEALPSVELVAGRGIGAIQLGMRRDALPAGTTFLPNQEGEFEALRFLLDEDSVREVWIPNLRYHPAPVIYRGQRVDRSLGVEELKRLFGPCARIRAEVAHARYRCADGLVLGFDFKEAGELVQIRVPGKGAE